MERLEQQPGQSLPPTRGQDRADAVQAMFNRIAGTYDLLNDFISLGMHRQWKRQAARCLKLAPGDHVLDVCTGTGDFVGYLTPHLGPEGRVTGLDFSQEMLNCARKRFDGHPQADFLQGDAMALPFDDNVFDGAVVGFGLRNVEDPAVAIGEMARVVKPGKWVVNLDTRPDPKMPGFKLYFSMVMPLIGRLFSNDPHAYSYLYKSTEDFLTPDELARQFEATGLRNIHVQSLAFGTVSLIAGQKPDVVPSVD